MALEEFMHLSPTREFEIAAQMASHIQQNFADFLGNHYYIHLADAGDGRAVVDEIRHLNKLKHIWNFVYIEREKTACILIRSDDASISMLLCGEYEWADYTITATLAALVDGPRESLLRSFRKCTLTPYEILEAFDMMGTSLEDFKNKKFG